MTKLLFILWLILFAALCGYTWGCAAYPRVTFVNGCTDQGCGIIRITDYNDGRRECVPVDPITREPIKREGSPK